MILIRPNLTNSLTYLYSQVSNSEGTNKTNFQSTCPLCQMLYARLYMYATPHACQFFLHGYIKSNVIMFLFPLKEKLAGANFSLNIIGPGFYNEMKI